VQFPQEAVVAVLCVLRVSVVTAVPVPLATLSSHQSSRHLRYMRRASLLAAGSLVLLAGCLSGGTGSRTPAPAAPAANVPTLNTAGPWRVSAPSGLEKVAITTTAVVTITSDTAVRTDTVRASLGASYTWTGASPRKVDGLLTDYRVALDTGLAITPGGLQLPRPYSAVSKGLSSGMTFTLPAEQTACAEPALSALQALQEAWVEVPADLRVGLEWRDTVRTLSCRDRVPLHGTTVRRFEVTRGEVADGRRVLLIIERSARGRLTGDGEQFGEKVSIRGESSGTMRYALDPGAGRFVRAEGTSTLAFTLTSSRRTQSVKQASRVTLVW